MTDFPTEITTSSEVAGDIPYAMAEIPQDQSDPEVRPYVISFYYYNDKHCELLNLSNPSCKKALQDFKAIGMKIRSESDFDKHGIGRRRIENRGAYKKLFNRLGTDTELYETRLKDSGRIFYFDAKLEGVLYIIAITEKHIETDKQRR